MKNYIFSLIPVFLCVSAYAQEAGVSQRKNYYAELGAEVCGEHPRRGFWSVKRSVWSETNTPSWIRIR